LTDFAIDQPGARVGGIVALAGAVPVEISGIRRLGAFKRTAGGLDRGSYSGSDILAKDLALNRPRRTLSHACYYKGDIHGRDVALFVSGIGAARAYETAKSACRALPLTAYISIGLSASLSADLKPGSLVVAESTASLSDGLVHRSDEKLLMLARKTLGGEASFGSVAVSSSVITYSKNKKEVALSCKALALDMETSGAARACGEEGVPFLAIRAISDALEEDLPVDFNLFVKDGLDWPRFILHVVTHPGVIPGLIRLGKNSRVAARSLAGAVEKLVLEI
jgi:adenosylhomocysteine nucleosidase